MSCKPFQNKRLFDYSNLHFPTAEKMKTFHVLPSPQGCCCDDALRHRLHSPAYPMCYVQVSTYCMFPIFQMFHNLLPLSPPSHFHLHLCMSHVLHFLRHLYGIIRLACLSRFVASFWVVRWTFSARLPGTWPVVLELWNALAKASKMVP